MNLKASILMLLLDIIWLKQDFMNFNKLISNIQSKPMRINNNAAIVVYILMLIGLHVYVLPKMDGTLKTAFMYGGLFGFILYGVFDFTNMAIFSDYSLNHALFDVAWGTFLFTIVPII